MGARDPAHEHAGTSQCSTVVSTAIRQRRGEWSGFEKRERLRLAAGEVGLTRKPLGVREERTVTRPGCACWPDRPK